ncbi:MAG TPA: Lrp/AsnC family transcriptional regulator, partial [Paracoccaceae bacterium]
METLDEFDKRLLRLLQRDNSLSTQALAEQAGLSASPSWRRVRRLHEAGVIRKQ